MRKLIKVNLDTQMVSARELHEMLNIKSNFTTWFQRMADYGFIEQVDFVTCFPNLESEKHGGQNKVDYEITIDMAKQICMIQRTPEGKAIRQYLIDLEKAWNTPELVMARGLQASQRLLEKKDEIIKSLTAENEKMLPKAIFADAVTASDTSILMRELSKFLKQSGVEIGEKRLWKWMREHGYILKHSTQPSQRAMEQGLFEVMERTFMRGDKPAVVTSTTKVTGKGQLFFANKFLNSKEG